MNLRNIILGIVGIAALVLFIITFAALFSVPNDQNSGSKDLFSLNGFGSAGEYGYASFRYRGTGNVSIIAHNGPKTKSIVVINDSQAIQATKLDSLVSELKTLESYGYKISISNDTKLDGESIYVVPSGAIPWYVLFDLEHGSSNSTIIYIGEKDLVLSSGIRRTGWYSTLPPSAAKRVIVYGNTSLDKMFESLRSGTKTSLGLANDILTLKWYRNTSSSSGVDGDSTRTASVLIRGNQSLRLIYAFRNSAGFEDSTEKFSTASRVLPLNPVSIYPWEQSELRFDLERTNGTAYLIVKKDGREISNEQLRRVTETNVFIKELQFKDPGDYEVIVGDNSGIIGTAMLHVKELIIKPVEARGLSYIFSISLDGVPVKDNEAEVWLGNSTTHKKIMINDGQIVVNARPDKGTVIFNFGFAGTIISVPVENNAESLVQFYLKYSIPGLALIAVVFIIARLSRKPTYSLRFGDTAPYARNEVRVSRQQAIDTFKRTREDMRLCKAPITTQEFTVSLRRYITNGSDITEGNVEQVLKELEKEGGLESHREYFQVHGEGDIKKNALMRMVREKLIENGIEFEEKGGRFVTANYEIGSLSDNFSKKAIIVFDDRLSMKKTIASLSIRERAKLELMQANGMASLTTIDELGDRL